MTRDEFLNALYSKGLDDEDILDELVTHIEDQKYDESQELQQRSLGDQVDYLLSRIPAIDHDKCVANIIQWSSKVVETEEEENDRPAQQLGAYV